MFTVPYNSPFNMIEIFFRYIKSITYKKIYSNKNALLNVIINILDGEDINKSMFKLYKETLNFYKSFLNNYINFNLNY